MALVRTTDPVSTIPAIKAAVWSIDSKQPIDRIVLAEELYGEGFARQRFVLQLMVVFSAIAAMLTAAGIFGVLSQVVARRTREIGIRIALGARRADVMRLIMRGGLTFTIAGCIAGLAGALALTRFLRALLFGVRPADPVSFALVTIVMIAIAAAACWLPARRAMRVDPAAALRVE
jgi:ABC-type antimicrobial peptide transport system permease subunit